MIKSASYLMIAFVFAAITRSATAQSPVQSGAPAPATSAAGSATNLQPAVANVYIYRSSTKTANDDKTVQVLANNALVANLAENQYAKIAMEPGATAFVALTPNEPRISKRFPPLLSWPGCVGDWKHANCDKWNSSAAAAPGLGCIRINWSRLDANDTGDVMLCKNELELASQSLLHYLTPRPNPGGLIAGFLIPGSMGATVAAANVSRWWLSPADKNWIRMCGPEPWPPPSAAAAAQINSDFKNGVFSDRWIECKDMIAEAYILLDAGLKVSVALEAGQSYYISWSSEALTLVDPSTGSAAVANLQEESQ